MLYTLYEASSLVPAEGKGKRTKIGKGGGEGKVENLPGARAVSQAGGSKAGRGLARAGLRSHGTRCRNSEVVGEEARAMFPSSPDTAAAQHQRCTTVTAQGSSAACYALSPGPAAAHTSHSTQAKGWHFPRISSTSWFPAGIGCCLKCVPYYSHS